MDKSLKRVNLMIKADQAQQVAGQDLNLSGLVRDLLDDYFSEHKITLSVSEETRNIYDKVISNTGSTDMDIEVHLREALRKLLREKIDLMQKLEKEI